METIPLRLREDPLEHPEPRTEPAKPRPMLPAQSRVMIEARHASTFVVPLTTKLVDDADPRRVRVHTSSRLLRDSDVLTGQLRAIDHRPFRRGPVSRLDAPLMKTKRLCPGELT